MTVNISLFAGAGAQFFDDNGVPLSGGLLYTYAAGTTTAAATYTSITGLSANSNPIVLDAGGRVPNEIWLTTGSSYKFVLQDSDNILIGTWDNIPGVNDYTVLTAALANQTDPALGDALIGFRQANNTGLISGAVGRTVHQKLQDLVSVKDFGAKGDGTTDDTTAIQAAIYYAQSSGGCVYLPAGIYIISAALNVQINSGGLPFTRPSIKGDGVGATTILQTAVASGIIITGYAANPADYMYIQDLTLQGKTGSNTGAGLSFSDSAFVNITNVEVTGWDTGVYGVDSLSMTFTRLVSRFNINGFRFESNNSPDYVSEPNAIGMFGCTIGNNTNYGGWVIGANTFTFNGGSIESNGSGTAMSSSMWGLRFTNCGGVYDQQGVCGFSLQGVYFEANAGQANLWVEQTVSRPGMSASISGCSFVVLGGSYPSSSVYLATTNPSYAFPISFVGCGWGGLNVYTPSSSRPTINNVGNAFKLALVGCNFYSSVDQYKQGAPNRFEGTVEAAAYTDLAGNPIGGGGGGGNLQSVLTSGNTSSLNAVFDQTTPGSDGIGIGSGTYAGATASGIATYDGRMFLTNNGLDTDPYVLDFNGANFQPIVDSTEVNALTLGGSANRWNGFYLNNTFNWNGYGIAAPTGDSTLFLRNDGTWSAATGTGGGTVTSITAGTGLNGGTITSSGTISLNNTAVTAGSYTSANITVDAQGRITAAANGTGGTTPTLAQVTAAGNITTLNGIFGQTASGNGIGVGGATPGGAMGISTYDGTMFLTNNGTAASPYAIDFNGAYFRPSVDSGAANALTLGSTARRWNGFYLSNTFTWNGYGIAQPTGDTTLFLRNDGTWAVPASSSGGVSSFNARTGAVSLLNSDVTSALAYTPASISSTNSFSANQSVNGVTVGTVSSVPTVASTTAQLNLSNTSSTVGLLTAGGFTSFLPGADNTINLGASGYSWKTLYLTGAMTWNSYSISAPSGSTSTFLRNDGTWAAPVFSGVTSFNSRTGVVTLSSGDVTGALGYTPYQTGGALGTPSSGNLTNCTFPTLNQNTTGTAAGLSGGTLSTSSYTLSSSSSLVALGNSSGQGVFVNGSGSFSSSVDNTMSCGTSGFRWTTVYATTGTINTSDANQKEQIADLSAAELAVAKRIKGLFKTFKFKDSVVAKGDGARIHVGVMAQDVQAAFAAEGLDANRYGIFCSDTIDDVTTLGVRYEELLAFVIAAL
jgi:hypothetical protein